MLLSKQFFSEKGFVKKSQILLVSIFALCIPLYSKLSTIVLLLLVFCSLFIKNKNPFKRLSFLLFPLLYGLTIISIVYSENYDWSYLEKRASFIAFPLIFMSLELKSEDYVKILKFFILGCLIGVVSCYGYALFNSFALTEGVMVFQPVVNPEFSFFYSVVRDGNYFFADLFSIFHQSTYFAIYLNTAIAAILSFSLWRTSKIYVLYLLVFCISIFQLSSKVGIGILFIILLYHAIRSIKSIWLKIATVTILLLIGLFGIIKNPRGKVMLDSFREKGINYNPEDRDGFVLRLMSWKTTIEIIKESPILGAGISNSQSELDKGYLANGFSKPLKERLNSHNQFLQFYLEYGFVGFVTVFLILFFILKKGESPESWNTLMICIFLILLLNFSFESVFNRYSGISYTLFFYYLLDHRSNAK